ncbi:MAG: hypothetical protein ACRYGF_06185 [Janthinobacterium lividum]
MKTLLHLATNLALGSTALAAISPAKHSRPSAPRTTTVIITEQPPVTLTGQLRVTWIVLPAEENVATVFDEVPKPIAIPADAVCGNAKTGTDNWLVRSYGLAMPFLQLARRW